MKEDKQQGHFTLAERYVNNNPDSVRRKMTQARLYNVIETFFYRKNSLLAQKKHPIKEALVKEIARFYTIFI